MNKQSWIVAMTMAVAAFTGVANDARAQNAVSEEVSIAISAADKAVSEARLSIAKGKDLLALIPEDSPFLPEVTQMLQAASSNWKMAVESLKSATESARKISTASSASLADDYALLAKVNANVALSGAKVVQIGLWYVEAVSSGKTEALDLIRDTMQDALAASSQVQFYYDKVKGIVSEKYSK